MEKIKKSVQDIVEYPYKEKSYLIYDNEGDFLVIYERRWTVIKGGTLYETFIAFLKNQIGWDYAKKSILRDLDRNLKEWQYLNDEAKEKIVDIDELYVDGVKQELS